MYLSRLLLNDSRAAISWLSNPYRVHQRLRMGCGDDPRMLYRVENGPQGTFILVQTNLPPDWEAAFHDFHVLAGSPQSKPIHLHLETGQRLRFRLRANPTVKRNGARLGLLREDAQVAWLNRKIVMAGARLSGCRVTPVGFQHSQKSGEGGELNHFVVCFEGLLEVQDPSKLETAVRAGIGSAKGFGCGLLSLAR